MATAFTIGCERRNNAGLQWATAERYAEVIAKLDLPAPKAMNMDPTRDSSRICFERLEAIDPNALLAHMQDPRIGKHLPLLDGDWDLDKIAAFVDGKSESWKRDGIGHWAILIDGDYAGWGGFEKDDAAWDFGLVLLPDYFSWGRAITVKALDWAREHPNIETVTMLLPLSRSATVLTKFLGARPLCEVRLGGVAFRKYILPRGSMASAG